MGPGMGKDDSSTRKESVYEAILLCIYSSKPFASYDHYRKDRHENNKSNLNFIKAFHLCTFLKVYHKKLFPSAKQKDR